MTRLNNRTMEHRYKARPVFSPRLFILALFLTAGCTGLKQCAYEGFNRDQWQKPQMVVEALQIRPGDHVADLGSGSGYFTFRLASAVGPTGKVYAVDIDRQMNDVIAKRAKEEGVTNIEVILAQTDDSKLPETGVDLIFSTNTYHHIGNRIVYFTALSKFLRPNGRIAVIDFDRRSWFQGFLRHYTPSEIIKKEMEQASYELLGEFKFLDRQSFLIFIPKGASPQRPS